MKLQGDYRFDAPRDQVWEALLDPEVLQRTLPGCERLERTGDNEFKGALNVQVGPVRGQFSGTLVLTDLRPREGYHMKLSGSGPSGFMNGEGDLTLTDADGGTLLTYDLDAQVGGRIAGVGQRLLDSSAKVVARQGLEGLGRQLAARRPAPAPPPGEAPAAAVAEGAPQTAPTAAPAPPPAPTQAEFAARFAGGLFRELVPPAARPWVIGGAVLILLLLIWLLVQALTS